MVDLFNADDCLAKLFTINLLHKIFFLHEIVC